MIIELKNSKEWKEKAINEWNGWKKEGNLPKHDQNVEDELFETIYSREFRKEMMEKWTKKQFLTFRKRIQDISFETIYYKEAIDLLAKLNLFFEYR